MSDTPKFPPHSLWAFVVYTVLNGATIWGIFGYAVFVLGHSGWWFLLACLLSTSQWRPYRFGVGTKEYFDND